MVKLKRPLSGAALQARQQKILKLKQQQQQEQGKSSPAGHTVQIDKEDHAELSNIQQAEQPPKDPIESEKDNAIATAASIPENLPSGNAKTSAKLRI